VDLLACWLVFPLVLVALCLGCGLLLDAAAGRVLEGALLVPAGFAAVLVLAQLATWQPATAKLATPLVVVAAVAGLVLGRGRLRAVEPWAVAAAALVFAVYAAPVVLSGDVTWAGFIRLDDTATWLAMIDRLMEHGRDVSDMAPSSYRETLRATIDIGYPVGSLLPLGAAQPLVGQDLAWTFQPYLAVLAALLAVVLHHLLRPVLPSPSLRAAAAFVGAQPAILYGYVLWGGIKEITAALLLPLLAALMPPVWRRPLRWRLALPLAAAAAAFLAVFGTPGGAWLGPAALVAAGVALWRARAAGAVRATLPPLLAGGVATLLLALPALVESTRFHDQIVGALGAGAEQEDLGNLVAPLDRLQVFGIWPAIDFRELPDREGVTKLLVAVLALAALFAVAAAVARRAPAVLGWIAVTVVGSALALQVGGAWVDGKTMAMTAPLPVALAMAGALAWWSGIGRRRLAVPGLLVAGAVAAGVLWSTALAYHGVSLAPSARMAELERIGERYAGEGPSLIAEYLPIADRHFLREMEPEGATDLRWRAVRLASGEIPPNKVSLQVDDFDVDEVLVYRHLVLRNGPDSSRPSSAYQLTFRGRYYDVYTRRRHDGVAEHLAFGGEHDAAAVPRCADLRALGRRAAGAGGRIVAALRPASVVVPLTREGAPQDWYSSGPEALVPTAPGTTTVGVEVPVAGRYDVWLGGSFARGIDVSVDGKEVGSLRDERQDESQQLRAGEVELTAGGHTVELTSPSGGLRPGAGDDSLPVGPLVLRPRAPAPSAAALPPERAAELCGQALDWAEVVVP
jgi:hypothetical protein